MYAVILTATMALTLALTRDAAAQTDHFSSEADSVSGTVTKTLVGVLPSTVTIAAVDQSNTVDSGSNDDSAASASQNVFGVDVYNFTNVNDSTSDSDAPGTDGGTADAATSNGSLLNGLVTWTSNDDPLACRPDSSNPEQIDCTSVGTTQRLAIAGVAVPPATYPAGSSFPVAGALNDPTCLQGTETFSGTLVLQESQVTGLGTNHVAIKLTGLHLVGDATCKSLSLVTLFTTHYDLAVAGPEEDVNGEVYKEIQFEFEAMDTL